MTETAERIVLASRPVGEPTLDNFRLEEHPIHSLDRARLLRTLWLSLDPYMRGRMSDAPSYAKPVGIGDVMEGGTVSEGVPRMCPVRQGRYRCGLYRLADHALSDGSSLQKVDPTRAPIQTALGVLGMPGMTAYMGLLHTANLPLVKPWWSQQLLGCVGIAGGPDKCRYVTGELGFDKYRVDVVEGLGESAARLHRAFAWGEFRRTFGTHCGRRTNISQFSAV